jgi:hypothetical protein
MPISETSFSSALQKHISRCTDIGSQEGDTRLVETLTKYLLGLLKQQAAPLTTIDGRSKLCLLLREFFEDGTDSFVDWWASSARVR